MTQSVKQLKEYSTQPFRLAPFSEESSDEELAEFKALFEVFKKAKYLWESTFDAIVHPVMIVNKDFQIERANLATAKACGENVKNLIGKHCYEIFAQRSTPCTNCPLTTSKERQETVTRRLEKLWDGREYEAVSFPLKGNQNDLNLSIVQYRDIKEEKQLQQRLVQSEKMVAVGLLAGGVAHEINNPLSGILAFTQLALRKIKEHSQLHDDLKEIEHSALRCKKIVENLLEFSRPAVFEERKPLSLQRVFEKIYPLVRFQLKEAKVQLKTEFIEPLPNILGNFNQLEQVFLNLISNACHAIVNGGLIQIRIAANSQQPGWICFECKDNGIGISEKELGKIFDPFFTTKKPGVGTGLGLSILYQIVQDHGGWIEVDSHLQQGTTFKLYFPIHPQGALDANSVTQNFN